MTYEEQRAAFDAAEAAREAEELALFEAAEAERLAEFEAEEAAREIAELEEFEAEQARLEAEHYALEELLKPGAEAAHEKAEDDRYEQFKLDEAAREAEEKAEHWRLEKIRRDEDEAEWNRIEQDREDNWETSAEYLAYLENLRLWNLNRDRLIEEFGGDEEAWETAWDQYQEDLTAYNTALLQYQSDLAAYNAAKAAHEIALAAWQLQRDAVEDGSLKEFTVAINGNIGRNNASNDFNGNGTFNISTGISLARVSENSNIFRLTVSSGASQGSFTIIERSTGNVYNFSVIGEGVHEFTFTHANGNVMTQSDINGFELRGGFVSDNMPVLTVNAPNAPTAPTNDPGARPTFNEPGDKPEPPEFVAEEFEFSGFEPFIFNGETFVRAPFNFNPAVFEGDTFAFIEGEFVPGTFTFIPGTFEYIFVPDIPTTVVEPEPVDPIEEIVDEEAPDEPAEDEPAEDVVAEEAPAEDVVVADVVVADVVAAEAVADDEDPVEDELEFEIDDAPVPLAFAPPEVDDYVPGIEIPDAPVPLANLPAGEVAGFITTGLILATLIAAVVGNSIRKMRTEEADEEA
ncbi:MAG: hypothetical protein FWE83_08270 [Oscillospiraceae bacterium]|nr:hypothetical protein [Oscillospiraceae bacterium]